MTEETATYEPLPDMAEEFPELVPPGACVDDHSAANRILARIAREEREIMLLLDQANDQVNLILARANELRVAHQRRLDWLIETFTPGLQTFARLELEGSAKRSVKLLSGTVGYRKQPDHLEIKDEQAGIAWAKKNLPDAYRVEESLLKKPVTEHIKTTGEVLDFAELVIGEDKFYIETA